MDLLGKKVLVAGCGKSGLGAAGLLQKAGAVPVLFDENEKLDGKALCAREDYPKDTALVLGSLPKELLSELSLAVLSPGISIEEAFVSTLEEADIPVWGEIELAWNYEKGKVLAIIRHERKDHDDNAGGRDHEALSGQYVCCRQYRNPLYAGGFKNR